MKLSPEDMAMFCSMSKPVGDEGGDPDDPAHDPNHAADEPADFEGKPKLVTKEAMDAAIAAAASGTEKRVREQMRDIQGALSEVRPKVGDLSDMAFDSAEGVYRHALKMLQVEGADTIHGSALKTILDMQRPAGKRQNGPAMDAALPVGAAAAGSFATRYPGADRIQHM